MPLRQVTASLVSRRTARTHPQAPVVATVVAVRDLTPTMRRVTLTAPEVAAWPVLGGDHYCRLLVPPGDDLVLPGGGARWFPALLQLDPAVRPRLRSYTLRHGRPAAALVDVDVVLHGRGGPASTRAAQAAPGQRVGLVEQGVMSALDPAAEHLLVVADDSGLPAALSLLEASTVPTTAVLEVATPDDEQPTPGHHDVTWLHRLDPLAVPGRLALAHLPSVAHRRGQAWVAGEAALATGVRRHLVRDRGHDRADVSFTGYFRAGRARRD